MAADYVSRVKEQTIPKYCDLTTKQYTPEARMELYTVLVFSYAIQLIAERMLRRAQAQGMRGTLMQEQKYNINNALRDTKGLINHLEAAFNESLDKTCSGVNNRYDVIRSKANEAIQLFMTITDKRDKDTAAPKEVMRFLNTLEGTGDVDLNKLFAYYKV